MQRLVTVLWLVVGTSAVAAQVTLTRGTNFSVHAASDGRLAIDLLRSIWIVPPRGGLADRITAIETPARRPRWSPRADAIIYEARAAGEASLWLYDFAKDSARKISVRRYFDQHPDWHPSGDRIVFASDRRDSGFDLWEHDLETGLTWRISHLQGDETEPAWSADGRDLVYVHYDGERWSIMLRRHGQPDRAIETAETRLSAPSWRPDGSLITFLRHGDGGLAIDMAILADPPIVRSMIGDEDLFVAPVVWLDRQLLLYAANGVINKRNFNSWSSSTLPFRATVERTATKRRKAPRSRNLPAVPTPEGQLVIRAGRLFDGVGDDYRHNLDIVIEKGHIIAVEGPRDRPGSIVVDMGDLTALPGFVDSDAALPSTSDGSLGPLLLSFGVTTIVADHDNARALDATWSGKEMPGPRLLGADWRPQLDTALAMATGLGTITASPQGIRYEELQIETAAAPGSILSALANARTPGLGQLLRSRQSILLQRYPATLRRFTETPNLAAAAASVVLGSRPNGLPPGIAQHAEFRALAAAGLSGAQALRTAGVNAAAALGLGLQLGRIAPGSSADIVLVDGDPLTAIDDAARVVGVVRNGRFFSVIGLLERSQGAENVE